MYTHAVEVIDFPSEPRHSSRSQDTLVPPREYDFQRAVIEEFRTDAQLVDVGKPVELRAAQ